MRRRWCLTAGTGTTPEEVFGVLGYSLAAAWLYDNATQTWAVYSPWNTLELNDGTERPEDGFQL